MALRDVDFSATADPERVLADLDAVRHDPLMFVGDGYPETLGTLAPQLVDILVSTRPEFASGHAGHRTRNLAIDIMGRLPLNEHLRPYVLAMSSALLDGNPFPVDAHASHPQRQRGERRPGHQGRARMVPSVQGRSGDTQRPILRVHPRIAADTRIDRDRCLRRHLRNSTQRLVILRPSSPSPTNLRSNTTRTRRDP